MNKTSKIVELYNNNKNFSNKEIANKLNVSKRHVRRVVNPMREKKIDKMPKILLIDIETSPMEILTWGLYKQTPSYDNITKGWAILSWAGKWLFDSEIMSQVVTPQEAIDRKEGSIIKGIWDLLEEATIVIGHNSDRFDLRKLNVKFVINGLNPPLPYQSIDTLKIAKKHFAFSSYSLDYLTKLFNLSPKLHTEYKLWKRCIAGDKDALSEMENYNRHDILALEDLYIKLRPYIKSHNNLALHSDLTENICPTCSSTNLIWKGYYYTPAGRFRSGRCNTCGAIFRSRYSDLTKEERHNLLISVAR